MMCWLCQLLGTLLVSDIFEENLLSSSLAVSQILSACHLGQELSDAYPIQQCSTTIVLSRSGLSFHKVSLVFTGIVSLPTSFSLQPSVKQRHSAYGAPGIVCLAQVSNMPVVFMSSFRTCQSTPSFPKALGDLEYT